MTSLSENELSIFLRNLASSIEDNSLNEEKLKLVSEFFISYQFYEASKEDDLDFMKFMTLGWYVYQHLLKDKT